MSRFVVNASTFARLAAAIVVCFFSGLALPVRLLLVYALDVIDCGVLRWSGLVEDGHCSTRAYHTRDKLTDLAVYLVVYALLVAENVMGAVTLGACLLLRAVGVARFVRNGAGDELVAFPDLFRELSVLFVTMPVLGLQGIAAWTALACLAAAKVGLEYVMHGGKMYV